MTIKKIFDVILNTWYIPVLLFLMALYINIGIWFSIICAILLIVAAIKNFNNHKILKGVIQILTLIIPILVICIGLYLMMIASVMDKPDELVSASKVFSLIKEKADLTLPHKIEINESILKHTEGAIDSDYKIDIELTYNEYDEEFIQNQINKPNKNGAWSRDKNNFNFELKDEYTSEPIILRLDTKNNKIYFTLIHL